jgi:hypothetical protein
MIKLYGGGEFKFSYEVRIRMDSQPCELQDPDKGITILQMCLSIWKKYYFIYLIFLKRAKIDENFI